MGMMKKMYEEGDENMKRTIAEAWTKANDKKGDKPDFSDRYDFLNKWSIPSCLWLIMWGSINNAVESRMKGMILAV